MACRIYLRITSYQNFANNLVITRVPKHRLYGELTGSVTVQFTAN